jgi:hypothetical protein
MHHLTELEEKLSKPGGFALQQKMLVALAATALRLRQQLAASVPRAEFESHTKALDATQAAIEVLQDWPTHPDSKALDTPFSTLPVHAPSLLRHDTKPHEDTDPPPTAATATSFVSPGLPSSHFFHNNPFFTPNRSFS